MRVVRPEYVPDASLSRAEMEALQRDLAADAAFADDLGFDPAAVSLESSAGDGQATLGDGRAAADGQTTLGGEGQATAGSDGQAVPGGTDRETADPPPVVAGVDQAFTDDRAVSAVVAMRGGDVIERSGGSAPLDIPYVPGLLSFREGNAIIDALDGLSVEPDLLVVDGSGRIHFRQAGIATHLSVTLDVPAVGVAKNLLCGRLREPLDDPLLEADRIAVDADDSVEPVNDGGDWPTIGYAYQSRQYPNPERRHVNPLYVSPGHRVGAVTAVDLVEQTCAGYKLPEPTRLADKLADELKGG
jgi:deoxyribonuclease V